MRGKIAYLALIALAAVQWVIAAHRAHSDAGLLSISHCFLLVLGLGFEWVPFRRRCLWIAFSIVALVLMQVEYFAQPSWLAPNLLFRMLQGTLVVAALVGLLSIPLFFLTGIGVEFHIERIVATQASQGAKQFHIRTMLWWMTMTACILGGIRLLHAVRWTAEEPAYFTAFVWVVATGVAVLQPRWLPAPWWWKVWTIPTAIFVIGDAARERYVNTLPKVELLPLAQMAVAVIGSALILRAFGYCLATHSLEADMLRARRIAQGPALEASPDLMGHEPNEAQASPLLEKPSDRDGQG